MSYETSEDRSVLDMEELRRKVRARESIREQRRRADRIALSQLRQRIIDAPIPPVAWYKQPVPMWALPVSLVAVVTVISYFI